MVGCCLDQKQNGNAMATALIQKQTANLLPPKSAEGMDKDDYRGMR
jgi:hypothetical protein